MTKVSNHSNIEEQCNMPGLSRPHYNFFLCLTLLLGLLAGQGSLLAISPITITETFDYAAPYPGSVNLKNGGIGWANAWTVTTPKTGIYSANTLVNVPLDYPNLTETGVCMHWWTATGTNPQTYTRTFQTPLLDDGSTYWLAFELKCVAQKSRTGIWLNGYATTSLLSLYHSGVGVPTLFFLDDTSTTATTNRITMASNDLNLLVFKIQTSGTINVADDVATVYLNPLVTANSSTWTPALPSRTINLGATGITGISLRSNNNGSSSSYSYFDEFRVASTAAEATNQGGAPANQPPVASFTASPTSGTAPLTVNFNASASSDSDGTISTYAWNFGDSTTGSGVTTSRTYNTAGSYTATLTVTDNGGLTATSNATITVTNAPVSTYALTVNSGTGDGTYAVGTVVNIAADAPASGMVFDIWTGSVTNVANVNSATTTITMPASATTVSATYKTAPSGGSNYWTQNGTAISYNNGNVGIGTSSPAAKLHVIGTAATGDTVHAWSKMILEDSSQESFFQFSGPNGFTGNQGILFSDDDPDIGGVIYRHAQNTLSLRVNNLEPLMINNAGYVGIGTSNPASKLDIRTVNGTNENALTLTNDGVAGHPFVVSVDTGNASGASSGWRIKGHPSYSAGIGTGPQVDLIRWDNSYPTSTGKMYLLPTGGYVGIGTTGPKMDTQWGAAGGIQKVNENEIALRYNMYNSAGDKYLQATNKASSLVMDSSGAFIFYNTNTASLGADSTVTGLTSRMCIKSDGKVGIGTQTPTKPLEVVGTVKATQFEGDGSLLTGMPWTINGNSTSTNSSIAIGIASSAFHKIQIHEIGSESSLIHFTNATTGSAHSDGSVIGIASNEDAYFFNQDNFAMQFGTNNIERMRITAAGLVGIGLNNPAAKLAVQHSNSQLLSLIKDQTTDKHGAIINFLANTTLRGRLGFTHTGANADTFMAGELPDAMALQSYGALQFATGGDAAKMSITAAGLVGIGTQTPTKPLEVVGTVKATQFEGDGSLLTNLPDQQGGWQRSPKMHFIGDVGIFETAPMQNFGNTPNSSTIPGNTAGFEIDSSIWQTARVLIDSNDSSQVLMASKNASPNNHIGVLQFDTTGLHMFSMNDDHSIKSRWIDFANNGFVGIGTTNPTQPLEIHLGNSNNTKSVKISSTGSEATLDLNNASAEGRLWQVVSTGTASGLGAGKFAIYDPAFPNNSRLLITAAGKVGIGTNNPTNALEVNGTIRAKEIIVEQTGWNDHVFRKDYKLPTLDEVESFINQHQHLEGIPSEKEVLKNGANISQVQRGLLQKVEELTLYTIQQEKVIRQQKEQLSKVMERLEKLENSAGN